MSTTLERRLRKLEIAVSPSRSARTNITIMEPAASASEDLWRQFAIRKAEAEVSAETIAG